ncbi:MAG: long-chain fatty acid--CoA ligase [Bacteroidota bacterium]|nr:long-chain fatty acid--CoA ligase [Bacteroidota bacterium]
MLNSSERNLSKGEAATRRPETLCELLTYHIQNYQYSDALNQKINGHWQGISSKEFFSQIKLTALGLYSLGVRQGDKVAILSQNSPQWVIADFAITFLGAATVPLYITQVTSQMEYILTNAGVKVLFCSSKTLFDRIEPALNRINLEKIIIYSPFESGSKFTTLDELKLLGEKTDKEDPELIKKLHCSVKPETVASIIYTSGTTGEPKGVVLTHKNLTSNAVDASSVISWHPKGDIALSFLPLSHIFERTMINIYLYRGVRIFFAESIELLAQNLQEIHPTIMSSVPRMLEKVYDKILQKGSELKGIKKFLFDWAIRLSKSYRHNEKRSLWFNIQLKIASLLIYKKWRKAVGGHLRFIISGGAPLSESLAQIYLSAGIPVVQGYGLTETSPVIAVNTKEKNIVGSVGKIIPNVEVKIARDGEIMVRGPNIMQEFYNSPQTTKEVFSEGWFCTGDIGYLDKEGFLFVTDRKKDLIKKSSGKFVAPGPIESKLSSYPFIDFSVLIGEARKFIAALLLPNFNNLKEWATKNGLSAQSNEILIRLPEVENLFQSIVDEVNKGLNPWEKIIKFIVIESEPTIASSELTPTMKLRRKVITTRYADKIEDLYQKYEHLHDIHFEGQSDISAKHDEINHGDINHGDINREDINHTKLAS